MKQILDDYAPILNVTPPNTKLPTPKKQKGRRKKQKEIKLQSSNKGSRQGNKSIPQSVVVKI